MVKEEPKPLVSKNLGGQSDDEDLNFGELDDNYGDEPLDSQQVFEKSGPLNYKNELVRKSKPESKLPTQTNHSQENLPTDSNYADDNWEDNVEESERNAKQPSHHSKLHIAPLMSENAKVTETDKPDKPLSKNRSDK